MKYRLQYRSSPGEMATIVADCANQVLVQTLAGASGLRPLITTGGPPELVAVYQDGMTNRQYEIVVIEDDAPWSDAARWRAWEAAMNPPAPATVPAATLVC